MDILDIELETIPHNGTAVGDESRARERETGDFGKGLLD